MTRWLAWLLLALALTGCASAPASPRTAGKTAYPDLGPAPELVGDIWLNTRAPLRLVDLRGKVVLVDMWTFD